MHAVSVFLHLFFCLVPQSHANERVLMFTPHPSSYISFSVLFLLRRTAVLQMPPRKRKTREDHINEWLPVFKGRHVTSRLRIFRVFMFFFLCLFVLQNLTVMLIHTEAGVSIDVATQILERICKSCLAKKSQQHNLSSHSPVSS